MNSTTPTPKGTTGQGADAAAEDVTDSATRAAESVSRSTLRSHEQSADRASEIASDARRAVDEQYRRAAARAGDAYERAAHEAEEGYRQVRSGAATAAREIDRRARSARDDITQFVDEHPLMVGVIGFASGLLIGALLPRNRRADRYSGGRQHSYERTSDWRLGRDNLGASQMHGGEDIERRSDTPYGHGGGAGRVTGGR